MKLLENERVRATDILQLGPHCVAEHERVHQAAGPGDDRRAAAGAPQDGNAALAGKRPR